MAVCTVIMPGRLKTIVPGPVGCEADMTCVSKQRPQTDACVHTLVVICEGALGVCDV